MSCSISTRPSRCQSLRFRENLECSPFRRLPRGRIKQLLGVRPVAHRQVLLADDHQMDGRIRSIDDGCSVLP